MATDTVSPRASHLKSVTVTALASLAGVGAAVVSTMVASGAKDTMALYVLAAAILVQFPLLQLLGKAGIVAVDVEDFGAKDYLYVAFMTFSLWFVCWTVLLTTGTTFSGTSL